MRTKKTLAIGVLALALCAVVGACSGGGSDSAGLSTGAGGDGGGGDASAHRAVANDMGAPEAALADGGTTTGGGGNDAALAAPIPELGLHVIKTAGLTIEIEEDSLKEAVQEAVRTAERLGGFVVATQVSDSKEGTGSVTIRVPAASFADALSGMRGLGEVKNESISGQDVTAEYIDLQARLRNLQAQESVLLKLMRDAVSVTDTIRVQSELQNVQLEIERLKGRIRYLDDQTDLSTIDITFREAGVVPDKAGTIEKAWERAGEAFLGVISATIIGAAVVVPIAFLLAVVVLLISWLRPRVTGGWERPAS